MPTTGAYVEISYTDSECSSEPSFIIVSDAATCGSGSGSSFAECSINSWKSFCTENRNATIVAAFQGDRFFMYDIYTDDACTDYVKSYAYTVGTCVDNGDGTSSIARLDATTGTGSFVNYPDSTDCSTEAYPLPTLDESTLTDALCVNSGGAYYYKFYTSYTLADASDGSSGTGSSTSNSASSSTFSSTASNAASASSEPTAPSATASTPSPTPTSASTGLSTAAVVGVVAGAIVAILFVVALVFCYRRRRQRANEPTHLQDFHDGAPYHGKLDTPGDTATQQSTSSLPKANERHRESVSLWEDEAIISWRIPREKVRLGQLLSRGGYGEVYKGTFNDQDVAVKMLLPETRRSIKHVNAFLAEVKMMAGLEHPCIVQFIGVAWDSFNDLCVVSEFMSGGDLRSLLARYDQDSHPKGFDYHKVRIAYHIAHALTYLHSLEQPVIHRDLKSKNVLLDTELNAKLTDFGVSRERADRTMTAGVGTSLWMAPEIMMGDKYGVAADMFSFGVLLSEIDVHTLPYSHAKDSNNADRKMPDAAILQMVAMGTLRVEFSAEASSGRFSSEVVALGLSCVSTDATARPTAAEALYKLQKLLQVM